VDETPGWRLGPRVLPQRFTIAVRKLPPRVDATGRDVFNFLAGRGTDWLELDVETSPTQPPRCVALRAPGGISTPEQRVPVTSLVQEACAVIASDDGTFLDRPEGSVLEDMRWEVSRARPRKRSRQPITPERLEEVARIAHEHSRTPTAAVQHHLGISRGYAYRLRKLAEKAGL